MAEKPQIPYLTADQMGAVDRLMIAEYGIELVQMMENAGRLLADLARKRFLEGDPVGKKVILLAGSGGNGGGAMAAARNLHNWGADVSLFLTKNPHQLAGTVLHQVKILQALGVRIDAGSPPPDLPNPALVIDGIIGYRLKGAPRGRAARLIRWCNGQPGPVLALDLPSGLDATSGEVFSPAVRATATLTLALPKVGLSVAALPVVGELYLGDIGVPPALYSRPPLHLKLGAIFCQDQILRLN